MSRRKGTRREKRGPFRINPQSGTLEVTVTLTLYDDPQRDGPVIGYLERAVQQGIPLATAFRTLCRQGGVKVSAEVAPDADPEAPTAVGVSALGDEL